MRKSNCFVRRIRYTEAVIPELKECTFRIACDVTSPLCGENGCSAVFGLQKGADEEMIRQMDVWLSHYAELTSEKYPKADAMQTGNVLLLASTPDRFRIYGKVN